MSTTQFLQQHFYARSGRAALLLAVVLILILLPSASGGVLAVQSNSAPDSDDSVLAGRFAFYLTGENEDRPLTRLDGSPIQPHEVAVLYGTADGMTIYDNGIDVCSWDYAARMGYARPLQPVYQDLSDAAGWPDSHVTPGFVAIDPVLGRFKLAEGDDDPLQLVGSTWTGFGVPGSGFIKLQDNYAYMPAGEGEIQVLDVSDPFNPQVIDTAYGDFNYALGVRGDYLYLRRNNRGMSAIDISDPTGLAWYPDEVLTRVWEPPSNLQLNQIEIRDNLAFVTVSQEPGLYILDLSDPLQAVELASVQVGDPDGAQWVFLSGNRAYVALSSGNGLLDHTTPYTHRWSAGFAIIDISDPAQPAVLGTYLGEPGVDIYSAPKLIGVAGDMAIMATVWRPGNYPPAQPARLVLVDATDPNNITRRGEYVFQMNGQDEPRLDLYSAVANDAIVYISDTSYDSTLDSLYLGNPEDYTTLFTFDFSDPDQPQLVDRYNQPEPSRFRHLTLDGNILYVNDYNYGVRVFDCSDPQHPVRAGGTITAAEGRFTWVNDDGHHAYFTETYGGSIHTIDIQNASTPVVQSTYWDGQWNEKQRPQGRGDILYVPTTTQISILDASDPLAMRKIGSFPAAGTHSTLSLFGDFAYVLTMAAGDPVRSQLHIYDIREPAQPLPVGQLDLAARYEKVFAQGHIVYAVADERLTLVDVSNADVPAVITDLVEPRLTLTSRDEGGRMWVRQGVAYIITGERNERLFHLVDVSDPQNPAYFNTFSYQLGGNVQVHHVTDIIIAGKYLYLGVYWGSFAIFDITDPLAPQYVTDGTSLPLGFEGWNASWGLGRLSGEYLTLPTLSHLRLIDMPMGGQGLAGPVSVAATLASSTTTVDIDIKPGNDHNKINLKSNGVISVAILSTQNFDATTIEALSAVFGPDGASEAHGRGHIGDVDGDGDDDMLLHFRTQATGIQCGDTTASFVGQAADGVAFKGSDSIRTIGCR